MNIYFSKVTIKSNCYPGLQRHFTTRLFFILTAFLLSCDSNKLGIDLDGVWEAKEDQKMVTFIFNGPSCQITVVNDQGEVEKNLHGEFSIDKTKQPYSISITKIGEINHALYSIIDIISSDSVVIAKFSPKWRLRPITFDRESSFKLKRVSYEQR